MKFTPGQLVGTLSGKLGAVVASHNRYGPYLRTKVIPTKTNTTYAVQAKDRLALISRAWSGLTDTQKAGWVTWANTNPITDRLGMKQVLQGNSAYQELNNNILRCLGTMLTDPPVTAAPSPLTTVTATYSIAGPLGIVFTASPLGAGLCLKVRAAVVDSPGKKYVANLFKEISISAAAATSPMAIATPLAARFGTVQAGQTLYLEIVVISKLTGLMSGPVYLSGAITA